MDQPLCSLPVWQYWGSGFYKRERVNLFMKKLIALLSLALSSQAFAVDNVRLGVPSYGGTGCPAGSASATLAPDASSLSLLFDSYILEAGGSTRKTLDRKSCNVAIPVIVPQGYQVSVFSVDYRGFNALPAGARSQFNVEYFFAGSRGPTVQRNFMGPVADNFLIRNTLVAETLVWSACGAQVILRANTNMMVMTNSRREQALSTLDSIDINAGIIYGFRWRTCR